REQEGREGIFHDVPESLPALLHARKVQQRARAVGFEYPELAGAVAGLDDELRGLHEGGAGGGGEPAPAREAAPGAGDGLGGGARWGAGEGAGGPKVDREVALRVATGRFVGRVEEAERLAAERGEVWAELDLDAQDRYFDEAKRASR